MAHMDDNPDKTMRFDRKGVFMFVRVCDVIAAVGDYCLLARCGSESRQG
jgi:hypothetical protein